MAIASPINSFVDFNAPETDCDGNLMDAALPAYANFGIKFQFKVEDQLLPPDAVFKAAVCSPECELLYNPNYEVVPLCERYIFGVDNAPLADEDFPILIGAYAPGPGQPQLPEGNYSKQELIDLINQYYEYALPAFDYYSCCDAPVISGITVFLNGVGLAKILELGIYYGYGYVNFPADTMDGYVGINGCFKYCILDEENEVLQCSNVFQRISNDCLTTVFNYYNEENAFYFKYSTYDDSGTIRITENQIRLWMTFDKPKHLIQEEVFRQSDNVQRRLSTLIEKEWEVNTSYLSILQHDKLVVMLKHDVLQVYNRERNLNRRMTQIGAPEPTNLDVRNYSVYPVTFNMRDYVNSYVNNNCGFNCGVELVDDCEAGGVTPPCPDKFKIEFLLGTGVTEYQNNILIGENNLSVEVYREGLIQYTSGGNFYDLDGSTGTLTFFPEGYDNERIAIIKV